MKTKELLNKVREIDGKIREYQWFDMEVLKYDGYKLTIAGGIDLCYCHRLEIIFEDIFFIKSYMSGWQSCTSQPVFIIPENEYELTLRYEIEQDYQLFIFKTEDLLNDVIIAAKDVQYSDDIVYRYYRENLQPNERLADFIKSKK